VALLALLVPLAPGASAEPCPTGSDPTARCGQELDRGADFINQGTVVRVGDHVVVAAHSNRAVTIAAYDARTGRRIFARAHFQRKGYPAIRTVTAVPRRGVVVVSGYVQQDGAYGSYVGAFSTQDGRRLWERSGPVTGHRDIATVAADERHAYVASLVAEGPDADSADWVVEAVDLLTGAPRWRRAEHRRDGVDQAPLAIAAARGRVLVVGYEEDGSCSNRARADVLTFDGRLVGSVRQRDPGVCSEVQAVAVSPDGRTAVAVGYGGSGAVTVEGTVLAVDLATGRRLWWRTSRGLGLGAVHFAVAWNGGEVLVAENSLVSPLASETGAVVASAGTFAAVPRVVAYDARTGDRRWASAPAPPSTRLGGVYALAVSEDRRAVYLAGDEGYQVGYSDLYLQGVVEAEEGSAEGFVRAVSLETHEELWTGRLSPDLAYPGAASSTLHGLVAVPGGVVALGTAGLAEVVGPSDRRIYSSGRVVRFLD
jgi:outer membrane protein assembly factor BamB